MSLISNTLMRAYLVDASGGSERQLGLWAGEGSLPLPHIWNSCAPPRSSNLLKVSNKVARGGTWICLLLCFKP